MQRYRTVLAIAALAVVVAVVFSQTLFSASDRAPAVTLLSVRQVPEIPMPRSHNSDHHGATDCTDHDGESCCAACISAIAIVAMIAAESREADRRSIFPAATIGRGITPQRLKKPPRSAGLIGA